MKNQGESICLNTGTAEKYGVMLHAIRIGNEAHAITRRARLHIIFPLDGVFYKTACEDNPDLPGLRQELGLPL